MRSPTVLAVAALATLLVACSGGDSAGPPSGGGDDSGSTTASDAAAGEDHDAASPGPDGGGGATDATVDGTAGEAGEAGGDGPEPGDAGVEADAECTVFHVGGDCILVSACAALGNHTSYSGYCPGPANIECCVDTHNEPTPAGWAPMQDGQVTAPMTTWAVAILNDPTTYPMYSTATMTFGTQLVLARVEWHPPDSNNGVVHRGVTLYLPAD